MAIVLGSPAGGLWSPHCGATWVTQQRTHDHIGRPPGKLRRHATLYSMRSRASRIRGASAAEALSMSVRCGGIWFSREHAPAHKLGDRVDAFGATKISVYTEVVDGHGNMTLSFAR
ncbi:hypothetical protein GN244_ATG03265 [Phytophthora infestans]|uniref:Uncharacterized protein n=1 Tax=Phytophthora infestans TaxID=4787 RepID=A0A833WNU5_PHYIN|nr:hypothetical protein GN244_ATG03265 [Phytophthora infestans]KAF4147700.1 hypothetical protein GN958_ATG03055 [Phytophthora infestans]